MRFHLTLSPLRLIAAAILLAALAGCGSGAGGNTAPLTLSNGATTVTVTSNPFQLSFYDTSGNNILAEVANSGQPPVTQTATVVTGATATTSTLYAPISFLVGSVKDSQWPGFIWEGNQLSSSASGTLYSAQEVIAASSSSGALDLTLSTNDPSGRVIHLHLAAGAAGTIRVQATPDPADGVAMMADSFASTVAEAFHGFGGRHNALDQHGEDFYNWIEEENLGLGPLEPSSSTWMFPNGATAAYHVHGTFVSSQGYGFLLNRYEFSHFRLDSDQPDAWQVQVNAAALDYSIVAGDAGAAIGALTSITGRQRVAPPWSLQPMLDRNRSPVASPDPSAYATQVQQDLATIQQDALPVAGYRLEGWAQLPNDTLQSLLDSFNAASIHTLLYFKAFVGNGTNDQDLPGTYQQAIDNDYVANDSSGKPYLFDMFSGPQSGLIDFSNPAAVSWWQQRISSALDEGADGFMEDFGEQALNDMQFANGQSGAVMHNRFPVLYHSATRALVDQYEQAHPGREIFFYTRSGHSGTADEPGSLAYDSANFLGDETTDFSRSYGLAAQITDMLNRGVGGAYGSTTDIGGYIDDLTGATTKELFIRWTELAALTPFFRVHNCSTHGTHMPWDYDQQTLDLYTQFANLHIAAIPLIQALWQQAVANGTPILQPLWLAYPGDATAAQQDQEFLLGPDVLVAPVVDEGASSRSVYLPAGCWQSQVDQSQTTGPATLTVNAPLQTLPYFFHCGTQPF